MITFPHALAWAKIKKRKNRTIITRLGRGLRARIHSNDVIGEQIFIYGLFEISECRFVTRFLKPGMVFFDVGANLGQYTLLAAQSVGVSGKVHGFEPNRRMFEELKFNVELNSMGARCVLNKLAVSDKAGVANLSCYEEGAEVYGSIGTAKREEADIVAHEEVATTTLDDYVQTNEIKHIDLIKMDIEGAELLALRGGEHLLQQSNAPTIVFEMSDTNTKGFGYKAIEIWNALESYGYEMRAFDHRGRLRATGKPSELSVDKNLVAIKPK